jgi:uncharacterized membrane protein
MATTIIGVFDDFTAAVNTTPDLVSVGIRKDDISVIGPDPTGEYAKYVRAPVDTHIESDIGTGAALGGLGGLLVGLAALTLPGIGFLVAAGPLVTAIAGATVGAATGGLIGALHGMGVPELEARAYEAGLREGQSLVIIRTKDTLAMQVMEILRRHRALRVDQRSSRLPNDDPTDLSSEVTR